MDSETSAFLHDAKRFILKNIHNVDTCPLQLYYCALIFAPKRSIIRRTFENELPRKLSILPKVEDEWGAELQTLEGHSGRVWSVVFSPDGRMVASGSQDNTVRLWDASTGAELQTLKGHSDSVQSVVFSPDGRMVASSSQDNTVRLWDASTGAELQTLKGHSGLVLSVVFSPDGRMVASGTSDNTVQMWDASTGAELQTLKGHTQGRVSYLSFSQQGTYINTNWGSIDIQAWYDNSGPLSHKPTTQVYVNNGWVIVEGAKVLWLPFEYRHPIRSAFKDGIIAFGHLSGVVTVIGF